MREIGIRRGPVPVLGLRRHIHHVAGVELDRLLASLLVVAAPAHSREKKGSVMGFIRNLASRRNR